MLKRKSKHMLTIPTCRLAFLHAITLKRNRTDLNDQGFNNLNLDYSTQPTIKNAMEAQRLQIRSEKEAVIKEIVGEIRQLYRSVYHESMEMRRRFGLTGPQSATLRVLARSDPLSSAELSRKLFVTPSNMTGIIDRLENKGLVKRIQKKGDRRIMLISLTRKGVEVSESLPDPIEKKLILGLADLDIEEIRELHQAMNRILYLIDAETNGNEMEERS